MRTPADLLRIKAASQYGRVFDSSNRHWSRDPRNNETFVRAQLGYAQDLLNARGHIFLNELSDMLGFPRTSSGQLVGWLASKDDGTIKWKMIPLDEGFIIEFTTQGIIYDKIED